jgi:hypothetical protein
VVRTARCVGIGSFLETGFRQVAAVVICRGQLSRFRGRSGQAPAFRLHSMWRPGRQGDADLSACARHADDGGLVRAVSASEHLLRT